MIEGWIESGDYPHVAITTSLPVVMGQQITSPDLVEHVAREAVVTVSDGEKTVQLEGKVNMGIFLPYYFTTTQMKGEVGKTYSLRVEYQDYVATVLGLVSDEGLNGYTELFIYGS